MSRTSLEGWIDGLNEHGVFFSSPLDFDLMMLEAFPEAYEALVPAWRRTQVDGRQGGKSGVGHEWARSRSLREHVCVVRRLSPLPTGIIS